MLFRSEKSERTEVAVSTTQGGQAAGAGDQGIKILSSRLEGPPRDMDPDLSALLRKHITNVDALVAEHRFAKHI